MKFQERVDHDIRMLVGDLQVQLIFAKARILELEEQVKTQSPTKSGNGLDTDRDVKQDVDEAGAPRD